ncbi:MAG: FAD-binding oxidoreductase [Acidimicrobiales bacterium]|nr:FAD-binding oxidoreductase [Acidimicrobiales bacterium]
MGNSPDAVVIGAGIFGCGITFELARRGLEVVCVDMNSAPGMGSTSASGAILRFNYSTVAAARLAWEGNQYWENFADYLETDVDGEVARKVTTGKLFLRHIDELHELYVRVLTEANVPFEDWDAQQVADRFPFLSLDDYGGPCPIDDERFWNPPLGSHKGGLYTPDAGYVKGPQLAAQNLHAAAVAKGATFVFNRRVTGLVTTLDGSRATGVELSDGTTVEAGAVVAVGGPWSSGLVKMAGLDGSMAITTRPMRHEAHVAPAPKEIDFDADGAIFADLDQGMYFRPDGANTIFVGSADPECDGHEWVDDLDTMNREITEPIWNRQMMRLAKRIPNFGVPHQRMGVAEAYDVSTDWGPVYDRTDLDGFFVAMGTSGNQFKNACVASNLMAELITAVGGGHDHDTSPLQVRARFTGDTIDMSAFSRNRAVNADSTGTVLG